MVAVASGGVHRWVADGPTTYRSLSHHRTLFLTIFGSATVNLIIFRFHHLFSFAFAYSSHQHPLARGCRWSHFVMRPNNANALHHSTNLLFLDDLFFFFDFVEHRHV